jgi:hypothetical protein
MKRIIYVPLDERPCNYGFPVQLAEITNYKLVVPPRELMGDKKVPANVEGLWQWLFEEVKSAEGAILSIDTLIYGGIVPSRLHNFTVEQCLTRFEKLKELKQLNQKLKIFAFNLIMRCPSYSSSDEEPAYYEEWGKDIFTRGYIEHRIELGIAEEAEEKQLKDICTRLPEEYWKDYTARREINREVNKGAIKSTKEGIIDFMIVPQDDSAPYGLTAVDQQNLRRYISEMNVSLKVYMYPGADEAGSTLLARMINQDKGKRPMVYTRFSSIKGPFIISLYEDRILYETMKYYVLASGGLIAESLSEADIVLMVNTPGESMMEATEQENKNLGYNVSRNLIEFVEYTDYVINYVNKPCVIADSAFANGGDLELVKLLREKKLLFKLAGYAGWNTNANTLGTCITQGMIYAIYGDNQKHRDFLSLRYVEDAAYCAKVRQKVTKEILPSLDYNYFDIGEQRGEVSQIVKQELESFIEENLNYDNYKIEVIDVYMPWRRMFEVCIRTKVKKVK